MASSNASPSRSPASSEATTISLIEAMIPTIRNGSATSLRSATVARTAPSSSTRMNTSSSPSSATVTDRGSVVEWVTKS